MKAPLAALALVFWLSALAGRPAEPSVQSVVTALMEDEEQMRGVLFADVVRAATGRRIIPLDSSAEADRALLEKISAALDQVLGRMNAADSPAHAQRRINEVSGHFEHALKDALNAVPGFSCDYPKTAAGKVQRTGYPDLRLADRTSGRIVYLDPKLYEAKSRGSSLRTFYYEPKKETNKVLDDAHHLLVGFAHTGKAEGRWRFSSWELVDLAKFRVRLKAEFQAGNRDLYQPESIVAAGGAAGPSGSAPPQRPPQ